MFTDVSEVGTASIIIALMIEGVRSCETSVNIYLTTRQHITEHSKLHTRRHENLKSHTGNPKDGCAVVEKCFRPEIFLNFCFMSALNPKGM
jgi:hypothetical protein